MRVRVPAPGSVRTCRQGPRSHRERSSGGVNRNSGGLGRCFVRTRRALSLSLELDIVALRSSYAVETVAVHSCTYCLSPACFIFSKFLIF